jgi:predicted TIM-barrel fold metal-dependent hydrolase
MSVGVLSSRADPPTPSGVRPKERNTSVSAWQQEVNLVGRLVQACLHPVQTAAEPVFRRPSVWGTLVATQKRRERKTMPIVDAQIHTWGTGLPSNLSHWQTTHFTPEEAIALMDAGGVDAAVIHPPGWDPNSTDMAFKAVRDYPGRFAIMGSLPLDDPESRARIATWREQPGMLGLRYAFLHEPMRQWLADGTIDWLWADAEKAGVPIAMLATDSLADIARIAQRHPALRLTIDHLGGRGGFTTLKDAAAMAHIPELLALAKFPNVAVKATGAPGYSSQSYPFASMHPYLRSIYDAFGPNRMFWGTDISKMPCSWRQCVTMFTDELPWLSDQDKQLILGDALCAWWGWNRTA